MKNILLILLVLFVGCGQKKTASTCTQQNTKSNEVIINCKTLRKDTSSCNSRTVNDQTVSQYEICNMGFDINCSQAKMDPAAVKANVDSGTLIMIDKTNGKRMVLKSITSGQDVFLILQYDDDTGYTSTVTLPSCSNN